MRMDSRKECFASFFRKVSKQSYFLSMPSQKVQFCIKSLWLMLLNWIELSVDSCWFFAYKQWVWYVSVTSCNVITWYQFVCCYTHLSDLCMKSINLTWLSSIRLCIFMMKTETPSNKKGSIIWTLPIIILNNNGLFNWWLLLAKPMPHVYKH